MILPIPELCRIAMRVLIKEGMEHGRAERIALMQVMGIVERVDAVAAETLALLPDLTTDQMKILPLVRAGASTTEVAGLLGISEDAAESRIRRLQNRICGKETGASTLEMCAKLTALKPVLPPTEIRRFAKRRRRSKLIEV